MTIKKPSRFTYFDELLAVRMGAPEFTLSESALPDIVCETTDSYINDLLDLGFIYSHQILIENAVGKDEDDSASVIVYLKADENAYALVTDLFHEEYWVYFTSYFADAQRYITTSQPGTMSLEQSPGEDEPHHIQNAGSSTLAAQWRRHKRFIAAEVPDQTAQVFQPDLHTTREKAYYETHVAELQAQNILQQSDTQTTRFTRSGARNFHIALTSKSAKRPKPKSREWMGGASGVSLSCRVSVRNIALVATAILGVGIIVFLQQNNSSSQDPQVSENTSGSIGAMAGFSNAKSTLDDLSPLLPELPANVGSSTAQAPTADQTEISDTDDRQKYLVAGKEDEMWRIAVENAEFFLLSNDGDPTPWVRTARKIAAGFNSGDSRLARTYFLSALLEPDYRVAEQQFNRALSIQTKALGLYHAETAQTLEALAWIAEHNKDDLAEAITHQRLAINIYHDIFGPESEDTKAAEWKLAYFEDRQAGVRPKAESNRRLLPALARFTR